MTKPELTSHQKRMATTLAKDPNFMSKIGAIGGRNSHASHLIDNPAKAAEIGKRGGSIGKRGYTYLYEKEGLRYYRSKTTNRIRVYPIL